MRSIVSVLVKNLEYFWSVRVSSFKNELVINREMTQTVLLRQANSENKGWLFKLKLSQN